LKRHHDKSGVAEKTQAAEYFVITHTMQAAALSRAR
jgi:hypothetical protein